MNKQEVEARFLDGIQMFKDGGTQPLGRDLRIESYGWRQAKKAKLDLEMALESAIEAFCEKRISQKLNR